MPDNFLGPKGKYLYTSDAGDTWIITRDESLAGIVGAGLTPLDPAAIPAGAGPKPSGVKLRGVWWQANDDQGLQAGARKFIICGTTGGALYASNAPQSFDIETVTGTTTGRTGEAVRFV